ncbi:hypothetical protein J6590_024880 [Homalodisca vitripennis]|nr:hypothetical protein J6590_024880 [Homalodisca vitripennis]
MAMAYDANVIAGKVILKDTVTRGIGKLKIMATLHICNAGRNEIHTLIDLEEAGFINQTELKVNQVSFPSGTARPRL